MSTDLAPAVAPLFVARPAGIATRFAAFVFDVIAIFISFAIGGRVVEFVMSVLLRHQVRLAEAPTASTVALIVWAFVYCTVSLASSGQTPGMSILGVRVVDKDGRPLKTRHAIVRVLAFPFSFAAARARVRPDPAAARPPGAARPDRPLTRRVRLGRRRLAVTVHRREPRQPPSLTCVCRGSQGWPPAGPGGKRRWLRQV